MLWCSVWMGWVDGGMKMKVLVIGVVLVFFGGCVSYVSFGGKVIELLIKEYFGQDFIECWVFGESENGVEVEDLLLCFCLMF